MNFAYKVKTSQGNVLEGSMEANDQQSVVNRLREQRFIILDISEVKSASGGILNKLNIFKPKVKRKDLVIFSRQLATLVNSGVPIVQSLSILYDQIENPAFKAVVGKCREDIESGITIADAMERHPQAFTTLYVSMVRAGEVGGILDVILERLSEYLEDAAKLQGQIKSAMAYPAVIMLAAFGVTGFVLVFVVPRFESMFAGFNRELPLPTKIVVSLSRGLTKLFPVIIVTIVGIIYGLRMYKKTESGSLKIDQFMLGLPALGVLQRKVAVAKFTRTFGTLIKSGVPILQALDTVAKTAGNRVIEIAINQAKESIREGERIAEPLKRSGVFPPMVTQMISVGEETGNLDTMLAKIADFYDTEVDSAVESLTAMMEPMIIVFLGVVVGGMVVALFLPMFEMGDMAGSAAD